MQVKYTQLISCRKAWDDGFEHLWASEKTNWTEMDVVVREGESEEGE